jgi:predicted aspartyl protease
MANGQPPQSLSFTATHQNGLARELLSTCHVSKAEQLDEGSPDADVYRTRAIWDTGATGCVITPELVNTVGLQPVGEVDVRGVGGKSRSKRYLLNIYLPNNVPVVGVSATVADALAGDINVIIGMSVITQGDFAVTNEGGSTTFSFRVPSSDTIDFVEQSESENATESGSDVSVDDLGRNDLVILHKPGEKEAEKPKKKHIDAVVDGDRDEWEAIVPPESR